MSTKRKPIRFILVCLTFIGCGFFIYYITPSISSFFSNKIEYSVDKDLEAGKAGVLEDAISKDEEGKLLEEENTASLIPVTHIKTPEKVRALYMSAWVAGSEDFRNSLVKIVDETELNAVVIDIKDSTGRVSFYTDDPLIKKIGSSENRIKDIRALTALLHKKGIYIIGRVSVFQDPYLTKIKPEWAVKRLSDGGVWKDRKGLSFLDPTSKDVHNYILAIALDSYKNGFDEINFDYIRYPSDGNMKDINYNLSPGRTRADNIESFFKYLSTEMKKTENIPISADLFGLTTEAKDDMGIGQVWEKAIPYFDFVCPMVYPSHYPSGHAGYKNPAQYPYEVIDRALLGAIEKTKAINEDVSKIRPWLQDFDMGATYTKELVRAQMKAVYKNGLNSWMLWDPSNKYTPSALLLDTIN
ncbi:MAG TPA: putative glycoside hydrolase [Candidatus Paceibacterota bacterium]|nr:putative glycoside hydrolase [Candidatus Paceibacterota bacterium]